MFQLILLASFIFSGQAQEDSDDEQITEKICYKDGCTGTLTNPIPYGHQWIRIRKESETGCCFWELGACDLCALPRAEEDSADSSEVDSSEVDSSESDEDDSKEEKEDAPADCVLGGFDKTKCDSCGKVIKQTITKAAVSGGKCNPGSHTCAAGDGSCPVSVSYSWVESGFGACDTTCGEGTQSQTVTCREDGTSNVVEDSNCSEVKPETQQVCDTGVDCPTSPLLGSGPPPMVAPPLPEVPAVKPKPEVPEVTAEKTGTKRCEAKQAQMKAHDVDLIESVENIEYDECEAKCQALDNCLGFVYQNNHRRVECWLYSKVGYIEGTTDKDKSYTSCPQKRCEAKQAQMKAHDVDLIGESVKNIEYDECEAKCLALDSCLGFVYQNNHRRVECWLYSKVGYIEGTTDKDKSYTSCPLDPNKPAAAEMGSDGTVCEGDWKQYESKCFKYLPYTEIQFAEAKAECAKLGATLATITSEEENQFVYNMLPSQNVPGLPKVPRVWMGLQSGDKVANEKWDSGTAVTYTNWNMDKPPTPNSCTAMWDDAQWHLIDCKDYADYVCEKEANSKPAAAVIKETGSDGTEYALTSNTQACSENGMTTITDEATCRAACEALGEFSSAGVWNHSPNCFKVVSGFWKDRCHWNKGSPTKKVETNRNVCINVAPKESEVAIDNKRLKQVNTALRLALEALAS